MTESKGHIISTNIDLEMRRSYIDYAMSVIVSRALPDVRDGLKPVHRRILYAMQELHNTASQPHKKSARIVGEVLGRYHPHGDTAVYDAMVRLAQDFSTRYPLVDGHGNFGSMDGDSPAAMRYTEVRLTPLAMELLKDLDKDTVPFGPNFDDSTKEPLVLPSVLPNLLINGSSGIAVGMATNIPPHNLSEVVDALVYLIGHPEATWNDIKQRIPGPDFPTGGVLVGTDGLEQAYQTGRGSVVIRGVASVEPLKRDRQQIIITEIPYQTNKAKLIERIAELHQNEKIDGIAELRDESGREGVRIVVELKKGVPGGVVLNQLYQHTPLQQNYGFNMLALVDGQPQVLTVVEMLTHFLHHRQIIVRRRTEFELAKAEARAHILDGYLRALSKLDLVIRIIRGSETPTMAKDQLQLKIKLDADQAQAVLDLRLQRLTSLEQHQIQQEFADLQQQIASLSHILADEQEILKIIQSELQQMKAIYGDARRTRLVDVEDAPTPVVMDAQDLVPEEMVIVGILSRGYINMWPVTIADRSRFKVKQPSTVGSLDRMCEASNHDLVLLFTNQGRMVRVDLIQLAQALPSDRGVALSTLIALAPQEQIVALTPLRHTTGGSWIAATRDGLVKRVMAEDVTSGNGKVTGVISLDPGDEVIGVCYAPPTPHELLLATSKGMILRFPGDDLPGKGRAAKGIKGMVLDAGDTLVALDVVGSATRIGMVTNQGIGRSFDLDEVPSTHRSRKGVIGIRVTSETGGVQWAGGLTDTSEVWGIEGAQPTRVATKDFTHDRRATIVKPLFEHLFQSPVDAILRR